MKILNIMASTDPNFGGTTEAALQVSKALALKGHEIEFACMDPDDAPWKSTFPFVLHTIPSSERTYYYTSQFVPWLKSKVGDYDAAIIHGLWQYSGFGSWLALRTSGMPYVVYPHGMLDPYFKKAFPAKHVKKCVYWPLEYVVLRDAKAVCFTCDEERLLARQSFRPYKVHEAVVSLGISDPAPSFTPQISGAQPVDITTVGKRYLLFLGRLNPKRGQISS